MAFDHLGRALYIQEALHNDTPYMAPLPLRLVVQGIQTKHKKLRRTYSVDRETRVSGNEKIGSVLLGTVKPPVGMIRSPDTAPDDIVPSVSVSWSGTVEHGAVDIIWSYV